MTKQQTTTSSEPTFYNLTGTVSALVRKTSRTGTPYVAGSFMTTLRGKPARIALTAFGKSIDNLGDNLVDGATMTLRGSFGAGDVGRRTFTAVGLAGARKAADATA